MSKEPIFIGFDLAAGEFVVVSTPGGYVTSEDQSVVLGDCSAPEEVPLASMTGEDQLESKPQERPTLHLEGDGRGPRSVYVNGLLIEGVTMADTMLGIVEYLPLPLAIDKTGSLIRKRRYGKVRVKYHADEPQS